MKNPILLLLVICAGIFATSCASLPEQRINRNPELYGKLSSNDKNLVVQGRLRKGMTQDAVFLAWGRPDRVRSSSRNGKGSESWAYVDHTPVRSYNVGYSFGGYHPFYNRYGCHPRFGYGYGPGWNYGSGINFVPYISRTVDFRNGRVTGWSRTR